MPVHFRIARPVTDISRTDKMYRVGLGLARLDCFEDHEGFDGVMLGEPGGSYHFEFTYCGARPVKRTPNPEDLFVFYVPNRHEWMERCELMEAAGFVPVQSMNPYWEKDGRTYVDPDGYRTVIQCATWESAKALQP